MKNIQYTIQFLNDWHCGSGLAAGADADALVVKDENHLPYVPGKTMKGLVREAVETLVALRNDNKQEQIKQMFGIEGNATAHVQGCAFFTNAELPVHDQKSIVEGKLDQYLYRNVSSTRIEADGTAAEHSLRKTQVTVPCTLTGQIKNVPDDMLEIVLDALTFVKRMGTNRNRGLGRCVISGKETEI